VALCNHGTTSPQGLVNTLSKRAQDAPRPGTSCQTIATIGTRYLRARSTATDQLIALATDSDTAIQVAVLQALTEMAETAPDAVAAVATQIDSLTDASDPNVRYYAGQCLRQIEAKL
jgi:hypothetical protein